MSTTTNVKQIKLHRMTKSQYDSATKNENEFYMVKDEAIDYNDLVNTPSLATVATSGSYNDLTNKPNLSTVATSGDYDDLTDKPTIGNATLTIQKNGTTVQTFGANATSNVTANITVPITAADVNAVAANTEITGATKCKITYDSKGLVTAGANLAASDIPNLSLSKITDVTATATELNVLDGITASTTELNYVDGVTSNVQTQLNTITGKIPSAATTSNQLADKDFVNSSINAVAAYYVTSNTSGDAFATHAALVAGPYYYDGAIRTPTKNDYAIVLVDEDHNNTSTRYTYTGSQWAFQYVVNDTAMTQAQINAINSGITSSKVSDYDTHLADTNIHVTTNDKNTWNAKQAAITGAATTITSSDLTVSRALVSNSSGKVGVSSVTSTELGYVHGVTSAIQTQIDSKLNKLTYEWNNAISFGSTGKLCIGKFCCYDSNITIDIDATTNTTYHGTLVIALQNMGTSGGGQMVATIYGDAANTIAPNLYIYKHGANDCLVEVYFSPLPWSKNIIHIRAVALNKDYGSASYDSVAFDLCTSVSEIPAEATIKPTNALDSKQATLVSGTNIKTINSTTLLGSGNISITGLPSQTSQSGKFLTTDGTTASWSTISQVPSQSGNSGKFLTTNGTTASWAEISEYTANEVETLWNSL